MKPLSLPAIPFALLLLASCATATVKETDWCVIETPDAASPGQPIEVKITLKEGAGVDGQKIANHLQWMRKDRFGGMLSWVPAKNAKAGETFVFRHKPTLKEEMATISPLVFLSPDGDFKTLTKKTVGESIPVVMDPVAAAAAAAEAARRRRPDSATLKNSSIRIEPLTRRAGQGDTVEVAVHYKLDPRDNWGDGTKLRLMPLGPWIDNPDGTYTKTRMHIGIKGLGNRGTAIEPGEGTEVFSFKLGKPHRYNDLTWMATFVGGDGKNWPWNVRGGGLEIVRPVEDFDVVVPAPGGLFAYAETPRVDLVWGRKAKAGTAYDVAFTFTDSDGNAVGSATRQVTAGAAGETTAIELPELKAPGALLVEAAIEGLGVHDATLARIPDLPALLGKRRTPFGATNLTTPEQSIVARKLGLTYCRQFVNWYDIEPLEGQWKLDGLERAIDANNAADLVPWICLVKPPSWIIPGNLHGAGFEPFPFHRDKWARSATHLARTFKGRIWGFEWLNEIVPGKKTPTPERDYIEFSAIGTKAAKAVDPAFKIQMAGGLWPRNFRTDLLALGLPEHVDVLPVHYSNRGGVLEARRDADAAGARRLGVWDNESAAGLSVWGMPGREALVRSVVQSKWVLRNWPAELVAGAEAVVYFGGTPQAAGNWTYLRNATTPRPVAATLAVMAAKIGLARPVGTAAIAPDTILHLFEQDGRGIAVASTLSDKPDAAATLRLAAGTPAVRVTDYKGAETSVATKDGALALPITAMPVILEGFDLTAVAAQTAVALGGQDEADPLPTLTAMLGSDAIVPVQVRNPLARPVEGTVSLDLGGSVGTLPSQAFALQPGESTRLETTLTAAQLDAATAEQAVIRLRWTAPAAIALEKPFRLMRIRPEFLGNLLKNGNMEQAGDGESPADWSSKSARRVAVEGEGPGFEGHAMQFTKSSGWLHAMQMLALPAPGQTYLYSAWVWNENMAAGSNLILVDANGTTKTETTPRVFSAGQSTGFWRLLTHRRATTPTLAKIGFQPVVNGPGTARYDNIRVTLYDDTDFAAEAPRRTTDIVVDGQLDDWDFADPIPLLCDNQISTENGYAWTPQNLSGIARFAWDDDALYAAVWVRDDQHVATATGEDTVKGDSLVIALHPENRVAGTDAKAFQWFVGAAAPGGGSGRHTLYRPAAHSGGLQSGQLARDSSVYEIAVKREGDYTQYELRMPWAETGGLRPAVGAKAGLSLQIIDADGTAARGEMTWGGGLRPAWNPASFGVLTLIP